jgi:hypothetical protein
MAVGRRNGFTMAAGWCWLLLGLWTGGVTAGEPLPFEDRIRDAAIRIDRAAAALGEVETITRLGAAFRTAPRTIADLHDQKLDFGEVAVVLAMAEVARIPADRILSLWASDRLSWSQIAERHGVEAKRLLQRLDALRRDLTRRPAAPPARRP